MKSAEFPHGLQERVSMDKPTKLKYMDIYNHFLNMIRSGILRPGSKLPSEGQVAEQFNVSRITVIRGLKQLQDEGHINRIQGSGSFVQKMNPDQTGLKIVSLIMSMSGLGREIQIIQAIEMRLKQAGYVLTVHNSHEDADLERNLVLEMKTNAQGMILYATSSVDNTRLFENLMKEHWPIVYIDRYPMNIPCSFVSCDNVDGGYQLGRYFLEAGHHQIALIYHDIVGLSSERDRFYGFMRAMDEGEIPRNNIKIISIDRDETDETVSRVLNEFYVVEKDRQHHPTAIFTFNDSLALMTMECIHRHKEYQLPENFILAGFDDYKEMPHSIPFVTIHQNYQAIGEVAAKLILGKIENSGFVKRQIVIPVQLVEYLL